MSGVTCYITIVKQSCAGAAAGALQFLLFVGVGSAVLASSKVVDMIGNGWCFTALAALNAVCALLACVTVEQASRRQQKLRCSAESTV